MFDYREIVEDLMNETSVSGDSSKIEHYSSLFSESVSKHSKNGFETSGALELATEEIKSILSGFKSV